LTYETHMTLLTREILNMMLRIFFFILCFLSLAFSWPKTNRIVSLAPVITEILFTLNAKEKLIGVTKFCDRPSEALKIKKIGGFIDPQLEVILALKPDLVIGMTLPSHQLIFLELKKRQFKTLTVQNDSIADIQNSILTIGKIIGHEKKAEQFLTQFKKDLLLQKNSLTCPAKSSVLLVISSNPLVVAGPKTFAGEVLNWLGVPSAVSSSVLPWPIWSMESVLKNSPTAIVATEGKNLRLQLEKQLAPVLKKTKLIALDRPILQRPGPHLIEDVKSLAQLLHQHQICHF